MRGVGWGAELEAAAALTSSLANNDDGPPWPCADEEKQRRMLTTILLVGGGSLVPGLTEVLEARLLGRLGPREVQFLGNTRDVDPRQCAWKGGLHGPRGRRAA